MYKSKFTGEQIDQACTNANVPVFHEAYVMLIGLDELITSLELQWSDNQLAAIDAIRSILLEYVNTDIEVYTAKPLFIRLSGMHTILGLLLLGLAFGENSEDLVQASIEMVRIGLSMDVGMFQFKLDEESQLLYWNEYDGLELVSTTHLSSSAEPEALEIISNYGHGILSNRYSIVFDLSNPDGCKDLSKWMYVFSETPAEKRLYPMFYIDDNYYKSHQRSNTDAAHIFYFWKQKELCKVTISKEDGSFTLEENI